MLREASRITRGRDAAGPAGHPALRRRSATTDHPAARHAAGSQLRGVHPSSRREESTAAAAASRMIRMDIGE
jgi:hypothetical protein